MGFIHACKYNYILWQYVYVQMNLNMRLMEEGKGMAPPCAPWGLQAEAWSQQSTAPALSCPPPSREAAVSRESRGHGSHMKHFKLM